MPALTGIHFTFGSPPSAGFPMLPDLSYMMTRFTVGSDALFRSVTHAAFVPAGSVETPLPFAPSLAPAPPFWPFASSNDEPSEPPQATRPKATINGTMQRARDM